METTERPDDAEHVRAGIPPTNSDRRRRPRPLAIAALAGLGLLLAWQLFAWLAFEPLLKWALPRALAERGGHQLTLERARLDPWRLAVRIERLAMKDPQGAPLLELPTLVVDLSTTSLLRWALVLDEVRLDGPVASVERRADGSLNWLDLMQALAGPPDPQAGPEAAPPRLLLHHLALDGGAVEWIDRRVTAEAGGLRTRVGDLELALDKLSTLPDDRGAHQLEAQTAQGATLRWSGRFGLRPLQAEGELGIDGLQLDPLAPYLRLLLRVAPPRGRLAATLAYTVHEVDGRLQLRLPRIEASLRGLELQGATAEAPGLVLDTVSLTDAQADLTAREIDLGRLAVQGGRIAAVRDATGAIDLASWLPPPASDAASGAAAASAAADADMVSSASTADPGSVPAADPPWRLRLSELALDSLALQLRDLGFATPLVAEAGPLSLRLRAEGRFGGNDPAALDLDGVTLTLASTRLAQAGDEAPWFTLDTLTLADGRLSLAERLVELGRAGAEGGRLRVQRDAQGRLSLAEALRRAGNAGEAGAVQAGASPDSAPWRVRVAAAQARAIALDVEDRSTTPPTRLQVSDLEAEARDLSEDLSQPVAVSMRLAVATGGRVAAEGRVTPGAPSADLRWTVDALALAPAAPYVARYSRARLADGRVDARGRLRWQAGDWRVDGGLTVSQLALDEAAAGERLIGWRRLAAPAMALRPQRIDVGEVTLDGLFAKVVVSRERTLNLVQLLGPAPTPGAAEPPSADTDAPPPWAVDIERLRVRDGSVDFADLSLALPFGARIRGLTGNVVGLRSGSATPAEVELDGQVDEYGLARVTGQLQPFDAAAYTDLKVVFRNVEMPTLTPYSATFAGRKIASGRLSLDLQYRLLDRQLQGDNRILMEQLLLGERVESPDAIDLPLDLAVAILQDADGRIDLGLPVSGSLDDPQFAIGQIVWKAIVNLLTRIVTAPFRALASLLGGGEETLDRILFDPGAVALLPPQREKLVRLAQALAQRPGLALSVQGGYDAEADAAALRERALRRAVALQTGRTLADDEDPGPIAIAEPAVRTALEALFVQRFGAEALAALRTRQGAEAAAAGPAAVAPSAAPISGTADEAASAAAASDTTDTPSNAAARLARELRHRLLTAQPVDEARLLALARQRAETIRAALIERGVAPQRLRPGEPSAQVVEPDGVPSALEVEVAAVPAAPAPAPPDQPAR